MKPAAVLLAGGLARRMGGGDKPLRMLMGQPILTHVVARIGPQVSAPVINANGDPTRFAEWQLPVVPDAFPGNPGPLAGIHAGMAWARRTHPEIAAILSVPTDLPFLPADLVERLAGARGADIAVARSDGQQHPVVALWRIGLADELYQAVTNGMRRVTEFAGRYRVVHVDFPVGDIDPFTNINTPDDLERAQGLTPAG